jgi:hypothetical protein
MSRRPSGVQRSKWREIKKKMGLMYQSESPDIENFSEFTSNLAEFDDEVSERY